MSNKYIYREKDTALFGPVMMDEPPVSASIYQDMARESRYENYLRSLPRYCSVSDELKFEDGKIVEEGRDFIIEIICPCCGGDGVETCTNPDHGFYNGMAWGDDQRLGCPVCGHDPNHKVKGGTCNTCGGLKTVIEEVFEEFGKETGYDNEPVYVAIPVQAKEEGGGRMSIPDHLKMIKYLTSLYAGKKFYIECSPTDIGAMRFHNSNFAIKEIEMPPTHSLASPSNQDELWEEVIKYLEVKYYWIKEKYIEELKSKFSITRKK